MDWLLGLVTGLLFGCLITMCFKKAQPTPAVVNDYEVIYVTYDAKGFYFHETGMYPKDVLVMYKRAQAYKGDQFGMLLVDWTSQEPRILVNLDDKAND